MLDPVSSTYRICPSSERAIRVGSLPIGTGVVNAPVAGVSASTELPSGIADPSVVRMVRVNGLYVMWLAPALMAVKTDSGNMPEVPPPGAGFEAEMACQPGVLRLAAGTVAINCVADTTLVGSTEPSIRIADPGPNPGINTSAAAPLGAESKCG